MINQQGINTQRLGKQEGTDGCMLHVQEARTKLNKSATRANEGSSFPFKRRRKHQHRMKENEGRTVYHTTGFLPQPTHKVLYLGSCASHRVSTLLYFILTDNLG